MKIALQDGNNDLYQKARNILIELGKNKESLEAMKEDEEITECATQMLAIMFKSDIKKAEGYKLVLLLCLKVLESQESKRKQVISIIKNLLCGFLTKKTKSLQESFFIEYLGQHLEIAWSLLIPLLKLVFTKQDQGARTELQRKLAQRLSMKIIKQTAKDHKTLIIEKALSKYEKVTKLVLKALDTNHWKNPLKYHNYFLTVFTMLSNTLCKNGMEDMSQVKKVKEKIETIMKKDSKEPMFKGRIKEMEIILKSKV